MVIGSAPGDVVAVLTAFTHFATPARMPEAARRDLLVVLDELLANVVMHGIGPTPSGSASVAVHLRPTEVEVVVADNGPPFDPLAHATPDTSLSIDDRPIGGLGIHLVQHLVDEARYAREAQHNILTLTKRLPDGWSPDATGAA